MTEINQSFSIYAGESKNIVVPITKEGGTDIDLTGVIIKWIVKQRDSSTTILIEKDTPIITADGNVLTIPLRPSDTTGLSGTYYHRCELIDSHDNDSVLFTGFISIKI